MTPVYNDSMEEMLLLIIDELRNPDVGILAQYPDTPDDILFSRLIDRLGKGRPDAQDYSKQVLLPYYQQVKASDPQRWQSWNIDAQLEKRLLSIMKIKPRRTASGVATITVITKPWRCASDCLYCPNDVRMPKSYLSDEPACQRAERNFFDPYLQVQARLRVLGRMGHLTDKIEIIVLGGSWCDYPREYQKWFIHELYRALNDGEAGWAEAQQRRQAYLDAGYANEQAEIVQRTQHMQDKVNDGELNYNQAIQKLYGDHEQGAAGALRGDSLALSGYQNNRDNWHEDCTEHSSLWLQRTAMDVLRQQQVKNETATHRMVGFTVETRPDLVNAHTLKLLREFGVTRLQIGIQSLDPQVLKLNRRTTTPQQICTAFALARSFGFKIHAHFMQNLYGSTFAADKNEYQHFMTDPAYLPDEVKLYPCSLVAGTGLCAHYADGSWQPYSEQELIELLAANTLNTPPFTRISRMIRDISSHDIIAGSKRTNLRQMVEQYIQNTDGAIGEIRHREVAKSEVIHDDLHLDVIRYETTVSTEYFLQWITAGDKIAGFLRLSLPLMTRDAYLPDDVQLPDLLNHAMIREVHVYGKVAAIDRVGESAQHFGLGRQLIEEACKIARAAGYAQINVISSVGTREYYRKLDFTDADLYQSRTL
ncbi:MAG: tRNA uridine(34) 5-carboxymethylaminomethyl modification radical SAM/GNAT enzyme Elp3 [Coriobacteriia bacterium]|nr:tRNA uridine(34) 5-carboxymethylaminomethyl modification radical SAM/GNAT enzyme Elp3 [Coriobacteriia bacterium]